MVRSGPLRSGQVVVRSPRPRSAPLPFIRTSSPPSAPLLPASFLPPALYIQVLHLPFHPLPDSRVADMVAAEAPGGVAEVLNLWTRRLPVRLPPRRFEVKTPTGVFRNRPPPFGRPKGAGRRAFFLFFWCCFPPRLSVFFLLDSLSTCLSTSHLARLFDHLLCFFSFVREAVW